MKILIRDINLRRILSANSMLKIFKSSIKNSSNEVITNHRTHNILIKLVNNKLIAYELDNNYNKKSQYSFSVVGVSGSIAWDLAGTHTPFVF